MLNINTNIPSLIAQRSLNNSTQLLNQAIERMTTGFKINHASDNAANYSISTNMGVKLSSYQVAEDNVVMGLDLLSTASGSLDLISDKLSRLRALAEQAGNGTYGEQSLKAINTEANAIVDEIERIYSTAEYNGITLFENNSKRNEGNISAAGDSGFIKEVTRKTTDGMTKLANVDLAKTISNGTYSISTAAELTKLAEMVNNGQITGGEFVLTNNIDLSSINNWTPIGNQDNSFKGIFDGNGYTISGLKYENTSLDDSNIAGLFGEIENAELKNLGVEGNITAYISALLAASAVDSKISNCYTTGNVQGGVISAGLLGMLTGDVLLEDSYSDASITSNPRDGYSNSIGGLISDTYLCSLTLDNCYYAGNISVTNLNTTICIGGLVGCVGFMDAENSSIKANNCYSTAYIPVINNNDYQASSALFTIVGNNAEVNNCYYDSNINPDISPYLIINTTDTGDVIFTNKSEGVSDKIPEIDASNNTQQSSSIIFQAGIKSDTASQIAINTSFELNVSSLRRIGLGGDYLSQIDNLLNTVSAKQTDYGAAENRLESALEEISTQYDNLVSSRSTLRDADIAEVSSEYIRQQILQQASATLLATANQSPALALQLL